MSDLYDLLEKYEAGDRAQRSTAAIIGDLNDRKGIKQALQDCDNEVIAEIFEAIHSYIC